MIQLLNFDQMNDSERALTLSAQGILNRMGGKVYVEADSYLELLSACEERTKTDIWELLEKNATSFLGFVSYDLNCDDVGINMAATISAAFDVLGVPTQVEDRVAALGIKKLFDLSEIMGSKIERQKIVFDYCKPYLNKNGLIHQVVKSGNFHIRLRDFSIAKRWACIYTGEDEEDRAFLKYILQWCEKNIPVYGWNDNEIAFIKDISQYGDYAVPTDWSLNHSYLKGTKEDLRQTCERVPVAPNKHYVAIIVSDGDNVQWLERNFFTEHLFGQRIRGEMQYKMSWTFAPSLKELNGAAAKRIYESANKDYFICGVSGIGYANIMSCPDEYLGDFCRISAQAMKKSDLNIICLLDNISELNDTIIVQKKLSNFTRHNNILGGIWEIDPDRYQSGNGKIFWSDGKPFVSVRFSLWHPSGDGKNVTKEWLDEYVQALNEMPVSPNTEKGYTVLNVHPWTITMKDVDYIVSRLSSDIELVYADELIELVKNNVKQ